MNKKITIVSTSDRGGAGKAATRLHKGLLEIGADSNILYLIQYDRSTPRSHEYISENGKVNELIRKAKLGLRYYTNKLSLKGREFDQEIFTYIDTSFDISNHELIKKADVINLHWISHFLDWKSFFKKVNKPIYWTLHDQNVFTGGCHYSFDCKKYENDCTNCFQLKGSINSSSFDQQVHKSEILKNKNIKVVTPSKWLTSISKNSKILSDKEHFVINNGLETEELKNYESANAREELGLPLNNKIILFVADDINKKHKGFRTLQNVLSKISRDDITLLSIGNGKFTEEIKNHINLGFISDQTKLAKIYSAADVFVTPSTMDNFPNTILESQLCGTPVIGFPVCGIKEMIKTGENGILADNNNQESLQKSIVDFIDKKYNFESIKIRKKALLKYSIQRMASNYLKIF